MNYQFQVDVILDGGCDPETLCRTSDKKELIKICDELSGLRDYNVLVWNDGAFVELYPDLDKEEITRMFS